MVQMTQIITANISAILLLLIINSHMKLQAAGKGLLDARILRVMINLTMFQCLCDTFVFWVDGKDFPGAIEFNWIGNIVYYVLNMVIAFFWPLFTEYKLTNNYKKIKKLAFFLAIPLVLCTLLVITTPVTGIVFTVSEDNLYARTGSYFAIPTLLVLAYTIGGTMQVYFNRKKAGKYLLFPATYFVLPITVTMLIQTYNYGISMKFIGIAIAITGVYLGTQNESAYIDSLCGVYNRRYYNDYVCSFCNANKKGKVITGVLVDMDKFKQINDNYGHHAGDKALIQFSAVLREKMDKIGFVVRYGGDEFVLLTKLGSEMVEVALKEIREEIEKINATGENEFKLAFSYGIATLSEGGNEDAFFIEMDKQMYEMKERRKANVVV